LRWARRQAVNSGAQIGEPLLTGVGWRSPQEELILVKIADGVSCLRSAHLLVRLFFDIHSFKDSGASSPMFGAGHVLGPRPSDVPL
jgi:hypothetical protein